MAIRRNIAVFRGFNTVRVHGKKTEKIKHFEGNCYKFRVHTAEARAKEIIAAEKMKLFLQFKVLILKFWTWWDLIKKTAWIWQKNFRLVDSFNVVNLLPSF